MTAYEMRIRDWSSDVCSSDLRQRAVDILQPLRLPVEAAVDPPRQCGPVARVAQRVEFAPPPEPQRHKHRSIRLFGKLGMVDERSEERRVGKSVSVRVDLGGRRIIKKKVDCMLTIVSTVYNYQAFTTLKNNR